MVEYTLEERPGVLVARLRGSLDAYLRDFTPQIEDSLRKTPRHFVVNLSEVDFIGSRGMGLLFYLHKILKDLGKRLAVASPSPAVTDAFQVGGIGSLLGIHESEDAAVADLGACRTTP